MSSHGSGLNLMAPFDFLDSFGAGTHWLLFVFGLIMMYTTYVLLDLETNKIIEFTFAAAPVWAPFVTFSLFFENWMYFVQKKYALSQGRVTLELMIPQEVFKSPEAMEIVLTQLYQTASPDNHIQTYVDGKHPPVYALELVSRGGNVKLYINVPKKKFKSLAETQLYAQYPGIEVHELDLDYTAEIPYDNSKYSYFSVHFGSKKADAYPIKTYIEYGLDKMPKEEEKNDPISTMLEMLGTVGPNEWVWVQILITANREVNFKLGSLTKKADWKDAAREEIKSIIEKAVERSGSETKGNVMQLLTDTEKDTIKSIERSLGKSAFDVAIRTLYIAKNESYNPGDRIGAFITAWRSYDDLNRNAIVPKWRTDFDWPWWQDPFEHHRDHYKREELSEYKRRTYTSHDHNDCIKVMTSEELATIFHIPGKVVTTPSLSRIPSKRAEAPSNLPIE